MAENQMMGTFDVKAAGLTADESEMVGKYLSFWTDGQLFAVPISDVVQIVGVQAITELPDAAHYVKGIIDLRGSIIPVIDVRLRLGKPEKDYDERTCIIVTSLREKLMGFVVDAVDEVTNIDGDQISKPPSVGGNYASSYLTGVAQQNKRVILLISTQKLLGEEEIFEFAQALEEIK